MRKQEVWRKLSVRYLFSADKIGPRRKVDNLFTIEKLSKTPVQILDITRADLSLEDVVSRHDKAKGDDDLLNSVKVELNCTDIKAPINAFGGRAVDLVLTDVVEHGVMSNDVYDVVARSVFDHYRVLVGLNQVGEIVSGRMEVYAPEA